MVKLIRVWSLIILSMLFIYAHLCAHSHSVLVPRSVTTDTAFELSLANYQRYHTTQDHRVQMYTKPFGMRSVHQQKIARYFLPNCACAIRLDEAGNGDVDPLWLSLIARRDNEYTSWVRLCPTRHVTGGVWSLFVTLSDHWWLGLNAAVMRVKHTLNFSECDRMHNGVLPGFATACDGFNNPSWTAGTLPCCAQEETGLDDVQGKLGYDFWLNEDGHATVYAVGTIPTGKRQTSDPLFEPLVGSKHGSFGLGLDGEYVLLAHPRKTLSLLGDIKYRYAFKACQRRSFDLCANGDWSRYLLVVMQDQPLDSQPAINLLTMPVQVTPRSTIDLWLALHYQYHDFHVEVGYDFWWRQAEKLCTPCDLTSGYGIQSLSLCTLPNTSAHNANISQGADGDNATVSDQQFTAITSKDLNLASGSQPHSMSQKIYGALGYTFEQTRVSFVFGVASSYEFKAKNALDQWAVWGTLGLIF